MKCSFRVIVFTVVLGLSLESIGVVNADDDDAFDEFQNSGWKCNDNNEPFGVIDSSEECEASCDGRSGGLSVCATIGETSRGYRYTWQPLFDHGECQCYCGSVLSTRTYTLCRDTFKYGHVIILGVAILLCCILGGFCLMYKRRSSLAKATLEATSTKSTDPQPTDEPPAYSTQQTTHSLATASQTPSQTPNTVQTPYVIQHAPAPIGQTPYAEEQAAYLHQAQYQRPEHADQAAPPEHADQAAPTQPVQPQEVPAHIYPPLQTLETEHPPETGHGTAEQLEDPVKGKMSEV